MTNKTTGGPAFPRAGDFNPQKGMSLRDYFAAKAMQAMMTAGYWDWKEPGEDSARCYAMADAMLKEREQ